MQLWVRTHREEAKGRCARLLHLLGGLCGHRHGRVTWHVVQAGPPDPWVTPHCHHVLLLLHHGVGCHHGRLQMHGRLHGSCEGGGTDVQPAVVAGDAGGWNSSCLWSLARGWAVC